MITKNIAVRLRYRDELWHKDLRSRDGTPVRCRVNGKCQTWKRFPRDEDFRLPVKYGLRECFYISNNRANHHEDWYCPDHLLVRVLADLAGFTSQTPPGIVRDRLLEMGLDQEASLLDPMVFNTQEGVIS